MDALRRIIILAVMIGCVVVFVSLPSYAHALLIEPVEPGVVKVGFADGTFPATTIVTVFNEDGEEIARGLLDENGLFHYGAYPQAAYLIADDRMGHLTRWNLGYSRTSGHHGHGHHDHGYHDHGLSRVTIITLTLVVLATIAGFFYVRTKKREGANF